MRSNNISNPDELAKILEQQGMTLEETKKHLLDNGLPDQVIQSEVYNRVPVGDREL